jgi:hypothetical protein
MQEILDHKSVFHISGITGMYKAKKGIRIYSFYSDLKNVSPDEIQD